MPRPTLTFVDFFVVFLAAFLLAGFFVAFFTDGFLPVSSADDLSSSVFGFLLYPRLSSGKKLLQLSFIQNGFLAPLPEHCLPAFGAIISDRYIPCDKATFLEVFARVVCITIF
jgi:hypothetical protein